MYWILTAVGIGLLGLAALSVRKAPEPFMRRSSGVSDEPFSAIAPRYKTSAKRRIRRSRGMQRQFTHAVAYLNRFDADELSPCARWLSENGRFLQEEIETVVRFSFPLLPAAPRESLPRIQAFAQALVSHARAALTQDGLLSAVHTCQSNEPFTVAELSQLFMTLRLTLCQLTVQLAQESAGEQRAHEKARSVVRRLTKGRVAQARRLLERRQQDNAFWEQLMRLRNAADSEEGLACLDPFFLEKGIDGERIASEEHKKQAEDALWVANAIQSLRRISRMPWARMEEEMSVVHETLSKDAVYLAMDEESRAYYRSETARLAQWLHLPEKAVCDGALHLGEKAQPETPAAHVGYYLLDDGQSALLQQLQKRSIGKRLRLFLQSRACGLFRAASWLCFAVLLLLGAVDGLFPLLWIPFAAVVTFSLQQFGILLLQRRIRPRMKPRIQLECLDEANRTLVVCPTMLLSPRHALTMVKHLSVLYQANRDEQLHFMLLGDFQDSLSGTLAGDQEIVDAAAAAIQALAADTGHPFFYLQRERVYSAADHLYSSRERKRGSLETLLCLLQGKPYQDAFAYASVPPETFTGRYRYVITLDSDTLLPPGSALRMVGTMLHPLQKRQIIDGRPHGVSVLQPKMETAAHTVTTPLSLLLGGQGGTDPYNRLTADFDQDVCNQGTFMGKGILDPASFLEATQNAVIPGSVLSHDLLEGELAGCAICSDITLYDGHPQKLTGFLMRLHRWTRGDWQLLPYVLPLFPKACRPPENPLGSVSKFKIWRNLLRSLIALFRVLLLAYGAAAGRSWLWACALLLPELPYLRWSISSWKSLLCRVAMLPCEAGMQTDAIVRTLARLFVTRRNLMQWTTANQLAQTDGRPSMRFFYLSMGLGGVMASLSFWPGACMACTIVTAALWIGFPFALPFLEQEYAPLQKPTGYMREVLKRLAKNTLLFYETAITDEDNGLPPDNVQLDPNKGISHRTSPTNIGLYLCALIAAEKLRLLSPEETARRIAQTIDTLEKMQKWNGHLYNWYDTRTLEVLQPPFVSSVDSGNLAVSLLCCAQGVRVLMNQLSGAYRDLPTRLDALAEGMAFGPLYDSEADLFFIGFHPETGSATAEHYDQLASESRLLSFVAIALGQVPLRHWYRLGRQYTRLWGGGCAMLSYSGTMFEYMMPLLFLPLVKGTLLSDACRNAFQAQRRVRHGKVFGVSESGYYAFDPELYYQYKAFGIPALAISGNAQDNVIAPYASFLSMAVGLKASFHNLLRLQNLGLEGALGMFEAADFCPSRTEGRAMRIVRSHMAHHQGMTLCAICNVLENNALARLFSELPRAQAYRLLLEEKPPRQVHVVRHPLKHAAQSKAAPPFCAVRKAAPLRFPVDAHLLSGGGTSLLIDAQGGGSLSRNGVMWTRFFESCRLPSGIRFYLRDSQSGSYWMVTDPALFQETRFETAQAVFVHQRYDVACEMRIWVNPLDGAVIHFITLQNHTSMERMMEVCSYLEPALTTQREDAAHPCFQNLLIQTERLQRFGIAAHRRSRENGSPQTKLWHLLATDANLTLFRMQSDRTAFLGRGRTVYAPRALHFPISATADALGDMVEPCLNLRGQFVLPPGGRLRFAFVTQLAGAQETPEVFCARYARLDGALSTYETALTKGAVTARFLGLAPKMQNLASRLVGVLAYAEQPMSFWHAQTNVLPLSALWRFGISGDLPMLAGVCQTEKQLDMAAQLLKAHAFFRAGGFQSDLVLVLPPEIPLRDELYEQVQALLRGCPRPDGVFVPESLSDEEFHLLLASARAVFGLTDAPLEEQLEGMTTAAQARAVYQTPSSARWNPALPPAKPLWEENGYGGFTQEEGNYQIQLEAGRHTPAPWCMPLCSQTFGTLASESGLAFTYAGNSSLGRLTRWPADSVYPLGDENFFLQDFQNRLLWSLTKLPLGHGMPVRITYAPGMAVYEASGYGVYTHLQCFTDHELGIRILRLKNEGQEERHLVFQHTCTFQLDLNPNGWQLCRLQSDENGVTAAHPSLAGVAALLGADPPPDDCAVMSAGSFQGLWNIAPQVLAIATPFRENSGNTALLRYELSLKPGESRTLVTCIAHAASQERLQEELALLRQQGGSQRLHHVRQKWEQRLGGLVYDLPDRAMAVMLSRWLPYQVHAARLWMRAGFYQVGGAYGFRDQLQDMLSLLHTHPEEVRRHLLLCAAHQFEEGDVQHWWHPPQWGVRTRVSDDRLFLPYVTALYVQGTGDKSVLEEQVPYLHDQPLEPAETDRYASPANSPVEESLLLHCIKVINSIELGAHGLPLMGGGDWNDGMNLVGGQNGESVWLGMFLCEVLRLLAPMCGSEQQERLLQLRERLTLSLERFAWDGAWYLRGWYHDGEPLGSARCQECRIDLLPQCWGVLCGVSRDRCAIAMENVWSMLYERDTGVLKLFTPPFHGVEAPGYVAGYLPGVRENGGQYTHAACWAIAALHQQGEDRRAWQLAMSLLPTRHAATRQLAARYRVEPYVMAADIYANPQQRGRGGWTWYTGSAAWYQYAVLTNLLGFQKQGNQLRFRPVLPPEWSSVRLTYRFGSATYHLHASRDCLSATADGEALKDGCLTLKDDGRIHEAVFPLHFGSGR